MAAHSNLLEYTTSCSSLLCANIYIIMEVKCMMSFPWHCALVLPHHCSTDFEGTGLFEFVLWLPITFVASSVAHGLTDLLANKCVNI